MNVPSRTLLIIDDSADDREIYRQYLQCDRNYHYTFLEAETGLQGLELWQRHQPDVVLLDYRLLDCDVLEILTQVQQSFPQKISFPVVVVTGQGNEKIAVEATKMGAQDYVIKGQITPERLQFSVNNAIETAQLRNQQQQTECEQRFRTIFDATFQFIGLMRPDGTLLEANQTALDFGGLHLSDVIGRPFWEARWWTLSPETQAQLQQAIATAARGEFIRYEAEVLGAGDRVISLDFSIKPIVDGQGQVMLLIPEGRNVSDRKALEKRLQKSEVEFRTIANAAPALVWACDRDGNNIYMNDRWFAYTGQTREEAAGYGWVETMHPDDAAEILPYWQHCQETSEVYKGEVRYRCHDGTYHWHAFQALPRQNIDGQIEAWYGLSFDISDRKEVEEALQASEERYRSMVTLTTSIVWRTGSDGGVVWAPEWETFTGQTPEQYLGWGWLDVVHPDDRQHLVEIWTRAMAEKNTGEVEYRLLHRDGQYRHVYAQGVPMLDAQGNVREWIGTVSDITERKQAQLNDQFLNNLDLRLRQLTDVQAMEWEVVSSLGEYLSVDRCLWHEIDWNNGLTTVERTWHCEDVPDVTGIYALQDYFTSQQLNYFAAGETMIVNDVTTHPEIASYAQNHLSLGTGAFVSVPCIHAGQWIAVLAVNAQTARNWREDEVVLLQETVVRLWSIIEQTRAVQELRDSEERFQIFMNNSPFAAFIKDDTGHIWYANCLVEQLFNRPPGELVGCVDFDFLPEEIALEMREHDRIVFETGEAIKFTELIPNADGEVTHWLTMKFLLGDHQQPLLGGIAVDISDRVQVERDRERILQQEQAAREAAERANRIKDEFLAVLSHELRTPLNPILGWAKLMQTQQFGPDETKAALDTIERSVKVQIQLIDDLLDVAKILRGKLSMTVGPVDLIVVIQAAIETVRTAASAKAIELQPFFPSTVGLITGDGARLQQIVWNLLSNAIKFTPNHGRVEIRLEQADAQVQIIVSDTGKGIKPEFLPHIFESFRQEDTSTTRQFGGLGLGLAIVRSLVEAHGGTIWADSPGEQQGATFTVQFPVLPIESLPAPVGETPGTELNLAGIRVLTVDDDPEARKLLTAILTQFDAEVLTVSSAYEVLALLDAFQPDVLVSDIGMPEIDGYGLIQEIRTCSFREGRLPAIALTAYAREEDQQRVLEEGFQQHLSKPIDPQDLVQAVIHCVSR